jgi:hypothetical protein
MVIVGAIATIPVVVILIASLSPAVTLKLCVRSEHTVPPAPVPEAVHVTVWGVVLSLKVKLIVLPVPIAALNSTPILEIGAVTGAVHWTLVSVAEGNPPPTGGMNVVPAAGRVTAGAE